MGVKSRHLGGFEIRSIVSEVENPMSSHSLPLTYFCPTSCSFLAALAISVYAVCSTQAQPITWKQIPIPGDGVSWIEYGASKLFVMKGDTLMHTSDDGVHWEYGSKPAYPWNCGRGPLYFHPTQTLFRSMCSDVFGSTDNGLTWSQRGGDVNLYIYRFWPGKSGEFFAHERNPTAIRPPDYVCLYGPEGAYQGVVYENRAQVRDFCVSPDGEYLLAHGGNPNVPQGLPPSPPRIVHRTPSGSWTDFALSADVYALATVTDSRSGRGPMLFAGDNGPGVWRSSDNGATWELANAGLANGFIRKLAVASDGTLFAGANGGELFVTKDDGDHWVNVSAGLPVAGTLVDIAFDDAGHIYVSDPGGIYKSVEPITDVRDRPLSTQPAEFSLSPNFPNPFNPSTTIRYGLPIRSFVSLTVYNALGQRVATLLEGEMEAGFHEAVFDAPGLASGVYLYRLTAGSYVETRKLALVR